MNIKEQYKKWLEGKYTSNTVKSYYWLINTLFTNDESIKDINNIIDSHFDSLVEKEEDNAMSIAILNNFQKWLLSNGITTKSIDLSFKYGKARKQNNAVIILTKNELLKLDLVMQHHNINDQLAIRILLDTGIRISELDSFNNINDWLGKEYITVIGKSKNERIIPITGRMKELATNLKRKGEHIIWPEHYNTRHSKIKKIGIEAEIPHLTAHIFRHTFATNWIDKGLSERLLMTALGHTTLTMLNHYVANNANKLLREWKMFTDGYNNHDIESLKSRIKYLELENERLGKLLHDV